MSTMSRFWRSCGLTSPNALPTTFSYCPTFGHENPPKVGGCERAVSISILVMRASAGDAANNAAASDTAKAMLKAGMPGGAAKRRLMDDSSLWTPLPSGFFTSPERQRALGRCYARGFVGSTVKTSQPVRSPPAPARSPSFSVLIPLDQGQAVRIVADAGHGRDDRARAQIDDRYVVRPIVRHDDLASIGGPGERERPRLAGGIVRTDPNAGELGAVRAHAGEVHVDDGDRVPFEIDIPPFPRGDGDQFAVRARLDAEGAGLHGNARRDFDDDRARERPLQIHHGYVVGSRVPREQVALSVAAVPQSEKLGVRPAAELRVGTKERNDRGRSRRHERNGEGGAIVPRMAQRHFYLSSKAPGPAVDEADAVRAVLAQPVFRVTLDEQVGQDKESDRPEPPAVEIAFDRAIGIVEVPLQHLPYFHDRDAAAPAVLQKLGVVQGAVMVDDVRSAMVLAEHDVRGIADRRAVEAIRMDLGAAHDRVRRIVVARLQRGVEVDRIDARISPPGREDEGLVRQCILREEQQQQSARNHQVR